MLGGLLSDTARDLISIASLLVTIVGFGVTLWQLQRTATAAVAAREAADEMLRERREQFLRYVLASLDRGFSDVKTFVRMGEWTKAVLRLSELAELASHLSEVDPSWVELADKFRDWESISEEQITKPSRFPRNAWKQFARVAQASISEKHGPFKSLNRQAPL